MNEYDLLQEAADPSTDPERLRKLVYHPSEAVNRVAWRNPSLPEDVWRNALLRGQPEAWANPMAPIYLLAWTPYADDLRPLEGGAQEATKELWEDPERCSPEGKTLIAAKVEEWWATDESARNMMWFLGWWAEAKGPKSAEHREALRILLLCVRTAPDLTDKDRQALDLLEGWTRGEKQQFKKAEDLAFFKAVKNACQFARDPSRGVWWALREVLEVVISGKEATEQEKAWTEHERHLADVIRREMPLPPVVE